MGRLGERLEEGACVLIFGVMTLVAFLNVVTRYVVQYALAFTEEVVVSLFVWLTLLGTAIAFRERSHLGFGWLVDHAPRAIRTPALWLTTALSGGVFLALGYYGLLQIRSERLLGTTSEALAVPQWWYTAGIPVLSALCIARIVQGALRAGRPPGPSPGPSTDG